MEPSAPRPSLAIPTAIIAGFALIAAAIYFSGIGTTAPSPLGATAVTADQAASANIPPVSDTDFIRGNPNAPIMIVEYSDYDCPFCQVFHQTMTQIMNEYGLTGKVAWVYRQFPIAQLHPNAPKISEAALCVGELAGNDAFWKFSDQVFASREVNQPTEMTRLTEFATAAGADAQAFETCLQSGRQKAAVDASVNEAFTAGIQGTPHSYLLVGNQQAVIEGAQPYVAVRQIVDNLLGQLEGTNTPPAQ